MEQEPDNHVTHQTEAESLSTPWRRVFLALNTLLASAVGFMAGECIFTIMLWFLSTVLHKPAPIWFHYVLDIAGLVVFGGIALDFYWEDFTAIGRKVKASRLAYHREVLLHQEEQKAIDDVESQKRTDRE